MTVTQATVDQLSRAQKVYRYFFSGMTIIILFVFAEPTVRRLVEGIWVRGRFNFVWTLSLDIHAIVAFGFLLLVNVQFFFGYQQRKYPKPKRYHARLGYFLFYLVIPLLLLVNLYMVFDRAFNVPEELSVLFRNSRNIIIVGMIEILVFLAWYTSRSFRAIRQGDILTHFDSILGAFMSAGIVAVYRFLYAIFWAIRGGSPLSLAGMFFLTMALVSGLMTLAYFLAGRLQQNKKELFAIIIVTALIAIVGVGQYTILDV